MLRKFLVSMAFAVCAVASVAAPQTQIDTSGLSDAQVAELKAHAAKVVAEAANSAGGGLPIKDVGALTSLASTWGQQAAMAAEGFARAFSIAAKELGVTVNEFLQTDAGKLTAALIIWKVAGHGVASLLYGIIFASVGMVITRVIYVKLFTREFRTVEYKHFGGLFSGTKVVRVPKAIHELKNDGEWLAFWVMLIICFASLAIGAAII